MTKVEAFMRPYRLDDVQEALADLGVPSMTVTEVRWSGQQKRLTQCYRGIEYTNNLIEKVKLEIVVREWKAHDVAETIVETARTGDIGDGKFFLIPVGDAIRSGEEGDVAVV